MNETPLDRPEEEDIIELVEIVREDGQPDADAPAVPGAAAPEPAEADAVQETAAASDGTGVAPEAAAPEVPAAFAAYGDDGLLGADDSLMAGADGESRAEPEDMPLPVMEPASPAEARTADGDTAAAERVKKAEATPEEAPAEPVAEEATAEVADEAPAAEEALAEAAPAVPEIEEAPGREASEATAVAPEDAFAEDAAKGLSAKAAEATPEEHPAEPVAEETPLEAPAGEKSAEAMEAPTGAVETSAEALPVEIRAEAETFAPEAALEASAPTAALAAVERGEAASVPDAAARVQTLEQKVAALEAELAELRARLDALARPESPAEASTALQDALDARLAELDGRLDGMPELVAAQLAPLAQRLDTAAGLAEQTGQRMQDTDGVLTALAGRVDALEAVPRVSAESVQQAMDVMGVQLSDSLGQFQSRLDGLDGLVRGPELTGRLLEAMRADIERAAARSAAQALREELEKLMAAQ